MTQPTGPALTYQDLPAELRARIDPHLGVGYDLRAWNSTVSRDAVWHFALGVGDDNPLWWTPERVVSRAFAPPTFLASCANGFEITGSGHPSIDEILFDYSGVWTTDTWHWEYPVWLGTSVRARHQLVSIEPRQSRSRGQSLTHTERTDFYLDDAAAPVAANTRKFLRFHRQADEAGREPAANWAQVSYDEAELAAISAQYQREPGQRRGPVPLRPADATAGTPLPALVKGPLTLTSIIGWLLGWGSNLCPTNRIAEQFYQRSPSSFWQDPRSGIRDTLAGAHWNERLARETGLSGCYDFGAQRTAWFAHALTDWMGDAAFLSDLTVTFSRPNLVGDTTWITGAVTAQHEAADGVRCDCGLEARNQRGELTASALATVRLPGQHAE